MVIQVACTAIFVASCNPLQLNDPSLVARIPFMLTRHLSKLGVHMCPQIPQFSLNRLRCVESWFARLFDCDMNGAENKNVFID